MVCTYVCVCVCVRVHAQGPVCVEVMSTLILVWLDAADVVWGALHQLVHQAIGLCLQREGEGEERGGEGRGVRVDVVGGIESTQDH